MEKKTRNIIILIILIAAIGTTVSIIAFSLLANSPQPVYNK